MRHIVLIAALGAAFSLLGVASTASAAAPETLRIDVDEFLPANVDCGSYSLDQHTFGSVILRERESTKEGELVFALNNFALKHTWSNPDTGESITYPDAGADRLTIFSDGSSTLVILGTVARVVVPGQGIVAAEIGRVELFFTGPEDTEPDVTVSGIHSGFTAIDDALCAALAPPA